MLPPRPPFLPSIVAEKQNPVTSGGGGHSRRSPSPPPSPSSDLRWLSTLDLACYSSFALCIFLSALATRELGARLLSLAVAAGCAAFAAAAGLAPRAYSRRRDLAAFAFRALFAAAINPMMAGGRRFPVPVGSWARFLAGRLVVLSELLLAATARLPAPLAAALAALQTALLFRAQRPACEAVLVGYVGSGSYYLGTQRFIDGALSASAWLLSAVSVEGGGIGGGGGAGKSFFPPPPPAFLHSPPLSSPPSFRSSSSSSSSSAASSEDEVRACVAVMTELQVVAALVLVAFGTRPGAGEANAADGDDDGDGPDAADAADGSSSRHARRQARLRLQLQRDRARRRRRLSHKRAFLAVASLGVLRVAWALLRSGGGGGGGSGGGGGEGFGGAGAGVGVGVTTAGTSNSSPATPSIGDNLKLVFRNGLFAP